MASINSISPSTVETKSLRRCLTTLANGPGSLPVADGQRPALQSAGHGRPRRKAAIQANAATARQMQLARMIEISQSGAPRRHVAPFLWKPTSASAPTPPDQIQFSRTQLATSTAFEAEGYRVAYLQNTLHELQSESSDPQLMEPCTGGDHALAGPLSDSQPPNDIRQTSALGNAQSGPGPSRNHLVRSQPQTRRRITLRDVVWFVMTAARLDTYHQKLVWLYAGNSLAARIRVLLWVRDFTRKRRCLPMCVIIREGIGAKGGVESVICQGVGCSLQKPFKEVQSAAEHVVSKHVGGMTWKCKWSGCEKAYNHSFDLKRHEKKHGVVNSTKQRVVTRIQRATSARSRGGRNTQAGTSSSFGPSLLAPSLLAPVHQPIFPPSSEYQDLSRWSNRGSSSPSSSTMGPPDSPFSTSFSHSTASTPARTNHPLLSPTRSTGSHVSLPAASQGSTLHPHTGSGSINPYFGGPTGMYAENAYNSSLIHSSDAIHAELSISQDSTASSSGSSGGLRFPILAPADLHATSPFANDIFIGTADTRYSTLPHTMPSTRLDAATAHSSLQSLEDIWSTQFQTAPPIDLGVNDALGMFLDSYAPSTHPHHGYQPQELSSLHVQGGQLSHFYHGSQLYGAPDAAALTNQSTSRRALASGRLGTTRGQPMAANTSLDGVIYSQDALHLHSQMSASQEYDYGRWAPEEGNGERWSWS